MFSANGRKDKLRNRDLKGSMTIEMSLLIPVVLFIFMEIVLTVFYYHDKNILNGAAYEAAVWGSAKMREKEEIEEAEIESFCEERLKKKCIFLTSYKVSASIQKEEIQVEIMAWKRRAKVSVLKKASITEPEKKIRDVRRLDISDGT